MTLDELEERLGRALQARTAQDLQAVTWDLPAPAPPERPPRSVWHQAGFRYHAAAYGFTNAFLVGTWALTGHGFFWPFFPAMGWGIGLGVHGVAAHYQATHPAEVPPPRAVEAASAAGGRGSGIFPAGPAASSHGPAATSYVAVLFVDVANSTGLTEAMGDAEWRNVRARHLALVRACVEGHRGLEVSVQGDGLFARFPATADAAGAAVEIQRRIRDRKDEQGFAPSVRIGLHAGEAVEDGEDLLGTVINVAARVTGEAAPDQILCTEAVADRLGRAFALADGGLRTLKGVARPRHLLVVEW